MQCPKLPKKATLMIAVMSMALMALLHLFKVPKELLTRFQSKALKATLTLSFPRRKARAPLVLYLFLERFL